MPEEVTSIQTIIEHVSDLEKPGILTNLEVINIYIALHMGVKCHREYDLGLEAILHFLQLKGQHSLITLTAPPLSSYSQYKRKIEEDELLRSSNVSELAFDEAILSIDG